jgi:hypothetical protein
MSNINIKIMDSKINEFLNDQYISTSIILFFILYSLLIAPKLSETITSKLDCNIVNLLIIIIVFYLASKNYFIGFAIGFAYLITHNTAKIHKLNNEIIRNQYNDAIKMGETNAQVLLPNINTVPKCELQLNSDNLVKTTDETSKLTQEQLINLIMKQQQINNDSNKVKENFNEANDNINDNMYKRIFDVKSNVDLSLDIEGFDPQNQYGDNVIYNIA